MEYLNFADVIQLTREGIDHGLLNNHYNGRIIQILWHNHSDVCRYHNPPHLHVRYGDYEVTITLKDYVVKGNMPAKELKRIFKWMEEHHEDLMNNWNRLQNGEEAYKIGTSKK